MSYAAVDLARCLSFDADSVEPDTITDFVELMAEHLGTVKEGLVEIQQRINADSLVMMPRISNLKTMTR